MRNPREGTSGGDSRAGEIPASKVGGGVSAQAWDSHRTLGSCSAEFAYGYACIKVLLQQRLKPLRVQLQTTIERSTVMSVEGHPRAAIGAAACVNVLSAAGFPLRLSLCHREEWERAGRPGPFAVGSLASETLAGIDDTVLPTLRWVSGLSFAGVLVRVGVELWIRS